MAAVITGAYAPAVGHARDDTAAHAELGRDALDELLMKLKASARSGSGINRPWLDRVLAQQVDLSPFARACLGHFAGSATANDLARYEAALRGLVANTVLASAGDLAKSAISAGPDLAGHESLTVTPSGAAPIIVVVDGGRDGPLLKVADVSLNGFSVEQLQRSDYESFLARHGGRLADLITALDRHVADGVGLLYVTDFRTHQRRK